MKNLVYILSVKRVTRTRWFSQSLNSQTLSIRTRVRCSRVKFYEMSYLGYLFVCRLMQNCEL